MPEISNKRGPKFKPPEEKKSCKLMVRLTGESYTRLFRRAEAEQVSLSDYVRVAIEEMLDRDDARDRFLGGDDYD